MGTRQYKLVLVKMNMANTFSLLSLNFGCSSEKQQIRQTWTKGLNFLLRNVTVYTKGQSNALNCHKNANLSGVFLLLRCTHLAFCTQPSCGGTGFSFTCQYDARDSRHEKWEEHNQGQTAVVITQIYGSQWSHVGSVNCRSTEHGIHYYH